MSARTPVSPDPIGIMMPWTGTEERKIRNGLLKAQQRSACRARSASSPTARDIFRLVTDTAASAATSPAGVDDLYDIRRGLCFLMCAADMFERQEGPRG